MFILLLCGGFAVSVQAQKKNKPPIASNNTNLNASKVKPSANSSGKKVYTLYKTDYKGTLSGNKCVEELSRKMGFRYEYLMKEGPGSKTTEGILFHNLGTKTILFFRNGPFWQCRFKKRMKECQQKTGDYVG